MTEDANRQGSAGERPNVLLILADQHRHDCMGAAGNADVRTPALDSLAADGVRYTNNFCPFPICTPSRYSLLTGVYVHQHRGCDNHSTLRPGVETFPSILREAGYRTKAVGKMHFTPTYLDVGFDEMELCEQHGPGRWDDDYHRELRQLGLVDRNDLEDQYGKCRTTARPEYWETFGALESNLPEEVHSTTWIGDRGVETIEQWSGGGNMLMVGFVKPHHPFDPPAPWSEMYDPDALRIPPGWEEQPRPRDMELTRGFFQMDELTEKVLRGVMAMYYATISQIDHHVGRMIDLLKEKGLYDETMIIYTSDHGDFMGFAHMILKGNHMYDPLVKVPLMVKWVGGAEGGVTSASLVNNVDVATSILGQAGCDPAPNMQGIDLAAEPSGRPLIFAEDHRDQVMVRSGVRKLILRRSAGIKLLFDLENDPLEMRSVHDLPEYQDDLRELEAAADAWRPGELPPPYLDEAAPIINSPNAQTTDDARREEVIAYYLRKMAAFS